MKRTFKDRHTDHVKSLSNQFFRLMYGHNTGKIRDKYDIKTKTWTYVANRYDVGNRIYQMQCDFMYLIKDVQDSAGNLYFVKRTQDFINECAKELRNAT